MVLLMAALIPLSPVVLARLEHGLLVLLFAANFPGDGRGDSGVPGEEAQHVDHNGQQNDGRHHDGHDDPNAQPRLGVDYAVNGGSCGQPSVRLLTAREENIFQKMSQYNTSVMVIRKMAFEALKRHEFVWQAKEGLGLVKASYKRKQEHQMLWPTRQQ